MTTNCIVEPKKLYKERIFTTGEVRRCRLGLAALPLPLLRCCPCLLGAAAPLPPARLLTTAPRPPQVGWHGVPHIAGKPGDTKDYSAVIEKALVGAGRCCRGLLLGAGCCAELGACGGAAAASPVATPLAPLTTPRPCRCAPAGAAGL